MQLVHSQLVLAAALAVLAQRSAAEGLTNLPVADALHSASLGEALSKASLAGRGTSQGELLKGLNVLGEDVQPDAGALTKSLQDAITPPAAERREEGGLEVLGHKVPTNAADLTKMLSEAVAPKTERRDQQGIDILGDNIRTDGGRQTTVLGAIAPELVRKDTGLDLQLDQKPPTEFVLDQVYKTLEQRDDFSTSKLTLKQLEPTAMGAARLALPIAMAPVKPYVQLASTGLGVAGSAAHAVGADELAKQIVNEATADVRAKLQQRDSLDLADPKATDLSGLGGVPASVVNLAAPIALSKVGGYVGTAQTGLQTVHTVSNVVGVPQVIEKTGAVDMVQKVITNVTQSGSKLPKLPKLPRSHRLFGTAGIHHHRARDESIDPLTKTGLALGDSVRETALKAGGITTDASNAFVKNLYGPRPDEADEDEQEEKGEAKKADKEKRNVVIPAFEVLPGAGPPVNKAIKQLGSLVPIPVQGLNSRMEKVKRRD